MVLVTRYYTVRPVILDSTSYQLRHETVKWFSRIFHQSETMNGLLAASPRLCGCFASISTSKICIFARLLGSRSLSRFHRIHSSIEWRKLQNLIEVRQFLWLWDNKWWYNNLKIFQLHWKIWIFRYRIIQKFLIRFQFLIINYKTKIEFRDV